MVKFYDPEIEQERSSYGDGSVSYPIMEEWPHGSYVKREDYEALVELIRENWDHRYWRGVNSEMANRVRKVLGMEELP